MVYLLKSSSFWGHLHLCGRLHIFCHLHFWGHFHFWGRPHFWVVFIFKFVFIFEVFLIFFSIFLGPNIFCQLFFLTNFFKKSFFTQNSSGPKLLLIPHFSDLNIFWTRIVLTQYMPKFEHKICVYPTFLCTHDWSFN